MNSKLKLLALLIVPLTLAACGGSGDDETEPTTPGTQPDVTAPGDEDGARAVASTQFIAMGDSGSGSPGQYAVGEAMAQVCELKSAEAGPCEFVLGFGDNIYEDGATSVEDIQFIEKFEKPFEPMGERPFYMVLGNHDNTGYVGGDGANNSRGDIQVDYHYEGNSPRWRMPARYYAFNSGEIPTALMPKTRDGKPLLTVVSLDSNPIASLLADADARFTWKNYGMTQLMWAQDELISSQALFNIAMAHHPYLSNGLHGNAGNYDFIPSYILPVISGQRWKDFLEEGVCDYADFIMTGHDHDLQLLEPVESCGRTRFLVSGAAGKTRCLEKVEPMNIARGKDFSGSPVSLPVPLAGGAGFDGNFTGPLELFREELVSGLNTLNMANPNAETQQAVAQLINGLDTLLVTLDAAASSVSESGSPEDMAQATLAVQAAAERLQAIDTSELPAPFDRLGSAFEAFALGFGGEGDESSGQGLSEDTAFLLGPVVQLVINLENILDAVDQQAEPVPVLRGVTSLLATTLRGVGGTLEEVSKLDSSAASDALIGSINSALNTLVLEVLLLEEAPDPINQNATLPTNFLSDALATVAREVTEQLDRNALTTADSLLGRLLSPITGAITGLIDRLF